MAKHHPILTLFFQPRHGGAAEQRMDAVRFADGGPSPGDANPVGWEMVEHAVREANEETRSVPPFRSMGVGAVFLRRPAVRPATFSTSSGAPVISIYVQPRRRSPRRGEYLSILSGTMRRLKERTSSPSDRAGLTSSIVLGMTALFQMDMFEGGVIDAAPLHRALTSSCRCWRSGQPWKTMNRSTG